MKRQTWLFGLLAVAFPLCAAADPSPIGFGPGTSALGPGLDDYFDWYLGTPSGCSTAQGPNGGSLSSPTRQGMCVGASVPAGDTMYASAWFADSSLLPVTTGLPIVVTVNDGTSKTCAGNLFLMQLAEFDWSARNAGRFFEVNCMASYGTYIDSPAGWLGHCTSGDDASTGSPCGWKSRGIFVRGGKLYLFVERQYGPGSPTIHDGTLIMSEDGGKTWKNPYTVFTGGPADPNGDAPKCGAASVSAGSPCTDAGYLDAAHGGAHSAMLWKALTGPNGFPTTLFNWAPIEYMQDGAAPPPGITDGCDPALYTCFYGQPEGSLARVLNSDLPSLDVSKWQYYTCPAMTESFRCSGNLESSWSSNFADRAQVRPMWSWSTTYIKEFNAYLMMGAGGTSIYWGPTAQGPWTLAAANYKMPENFPNVILGLGTTVVSVSPPHIKLTVSSDASYIHTPQSTPVLSQLDLVLGEPPLYQKGESPRSSAIGGAVYNAGFIFSDSQVAGTMPLSNLDWAFDFYDHGGNAAAAITGFHDVANGAAFLAGCHGPGACNDWNPGQGVALQPYGASISNNGYSAFLTTFMNEFPGSIAIGTANKYFTGAWGLTPANAPSSTQGNGSFTIAGVFQYNGGNNFWTLGDNSGNNTALSLQSNAGVNLELGWGGEFSDRWRYNSGFSLTRGQWYFLAAIVQANGASPIAHLWMSDSGSFVDTLAGVSRTSTGGTPIQTPNLAAAPIKMGMDSSIGVGGLFVYSRALTAAEVQRIYQSVKVKMAERGINLDAAADKTAPELSAGYPQANPSTVTGQTSVLWAQATDPTDAAAALVYHWTQTSGPAIQGFSVNDTNAAATTTATFAAAGTYQFQVIVLDAAGNPSAPGTVSVTVTTNFPTNHPPLIGTLKANPPDVDAGASGVQEYEGTTVIYSAPISDPDGDALTWQWYYTRNGGPKTPFGNPDGAIGSGAAQVSFSYPAGSAGTNYVWMLDVNDGHNAAVEANLPVSAIPPGSNSLPPPPPGQSTVDKTPFQVKVYPNPWRSDKHAAHPSVVFTGLTDPATLKIFTASGHEVKTLHTEASSIPWDLTNEAREKVASGIYLYLITTSRGDNVRGKLGVIK